VLVVSISGVDTELGAEALSLGAVDVITKPTAVASDRLNELGGQLIAKVLAAAANLIDPPPPDAPVRAATAARRPGARVELVMIGTSTGGPQALTKVIAALPATLPVPVVIVLHIPIGYTEALAARLDRGSALRVVEGRDGLVLEGGTVVLARAGIHLTLARESARLVVRQLAQPIEPFMPSVNQLFASGAAAVGAGALGVVLTGMGDDGLIGARAIAAAGGSLVTESASTCVVYGMPRCVFDADLGAIAVPLELVAEEIAKRV
jgi:two-component system chemotaxis response regulator CheB